MTAITLRRGNTPNLDMLGGWLSFICWPGYMFAWMMEMVLEELSKGRLPRIPDWICAAVFLTILCAPVDAVLYFYYHQSLPALHVPAIIGGIIYLVGIILGRIILRTMSVMYEPATDHEDPAFSWKGLFLEIVESLFRPVMGNNVPVMALGILVHPLLAADAVIDYLLDRKSYCDREWRQYMRSILRKRMLKPTCFSLGVMATWAMIVLLHNLGSGSALVLLLPAIALYLYFGREVFDGWSQYDSARDNHSD